MVMQSHDNVNETLYDINVMKVLMIWIGSSNKILSKTTDVYSYRNDLKEKLKGVTYSKKNKNKKKYRRKKKDSVCYNEEIM